MVGFGKLKTPGLSVIITDGEKEHKITWSNKAKQPLTHPSPGKFIYHWEDKMVYQRLPVGKLALKRSYSGFGDTLSPKVKQAGEKDEFENHNRFWVWLIERPWIGPGLADEIQSAFVERLVELAEKEMEEMRKAA